MKPRLSIEAKPFSMEQNEELIKRKTFKNIPLPSEGLRNYELSLNGVYSGDLITRNQRNRIRNKIKSSSILHGKIVNSKFFQVMLKLLLVKKFIRTLRENTFYRKTTCLKIRHFNLINDLAISNDEGRTNVYESFNEKIKFQMKNPIFQNLFVLFFNKNIKKTFVRFLEQFQKFLYWLMFPTSNLRLVWDFIVAIVTILNLLFIPIRIGFEMTFCDLCDSSFFITFSLLMFFLDMILNFNTPYYSKGELIRDRFRLFKNYLFGRFIVDLFSLTYLLMTNFIDFSGKVEFLKISGFLFILRLQNVSKVISKFEDFIFTDENISNLISFIRLIFNVILFSHWSACLWKYIGESDEEHGWLAFYHLDKKPPDLQYINSLYYVVVVINTVGFGDIVPQTVDEKLYSVVFIFLACMNFAYAINRIGKILHNLNKHQEEFQNVMNLMNGYLRFNHIDFDLKIKIRNYLEYIWQVKKVYNDETKEIINTLSSSLKEELLISSNGAIVRDIPLFKENFSEKTIKKIICEMNEINLIPDDIIFNESTLSDQNLYIIRDGEIELFIETPNKQAISLKILSKGKYFGEQSFFAGYPRVVSAKSISFSSLFVIKKENFLKIIKETEGEYEQFCQMKDQVILYKDYREIMAKCLSCEQENHSLLECPLLHLALSPERIVEKHNFSISQQRLTYLRIKQKKSMNALKKNHLIQISANNFGKEIRKRNVESDDEESKKESELKLKNFSSIEAFQKFEDLEEMSPKMRSSIKISVKEEEESLQSQVKESKISPHNSFKESPKIEKIKTNDEEEELMNNNNWLINMDNSTVDLDCLKNYTKYFPEKNSENLIDLLNSIAYKKEKKLKGFNIYNTILNVSPTKKTSKMSISFNKVVSELNKDEKTKRLQKNIKTLTEDFPYKVFRFNKAKPPQIKKKMCVQLKLLLFKIISFPIEFLCLRCYRKKKRMR